MRQQTLAEEGFEKYRKPARLEQFNNEMDQVIQWRELCKLIKPFYPKPKGAGLRPVGLERMLRIHFLQHWFKLSNPAVKEALYDSRTKRRFVSIGSGHEPIPDETMICKSRNLLDVHSLGNRLFILIKDYRQANGMKMNTRTIVAATIIDTLSSPKNKEKSRGPEMHQPRKGKRLHFGMKAQIGVDTRAKLIHSAAATATHVYDSQLLGDLLHGNEMRVWGDSNYAGQGDTL